MGEEDILWGQRSACKIQPQTTVEFVTIYSKSLLFVIDITSAVSNSAQLITLLLFVVTRLVINKASDVKQTTG